MRIRPLLVTLAIVSAAAACTDGDETGPPTTAPTVAPATTPEPTPTADPDGEVRAFVTDFMEARMARDEQRARAYLAPFAAEQYDEGEDGLTLIGTSNPHFESWEFVSIQAADASSYEVQVVVTEVFTDSDRTSEFAEVLFVGPGTDVDGEQRPFVVRGAARRSAPD